MKQKNVIIGALLITLLFGVAMGAIGFNAISNRNGTQASNGSAGSTTVQIILATPASPRSSNNQFSSPASASGGG